MSILPLGRNFSFRWHQIILLGDRGT